MLKSFRSMRNSSYELRLDVRLYLSVYLAKLYVMSSDFMFVIYKTC